MSALPTWPSDVPGPVPSPCNNVCRINAVSGFCDGCQRSIDEIVRWARLADDDKRAIWRELPQRAARSAPR